MAVFSLLAVAVAVAAAAPRRLNEVWDRNKTEAAGLVWRANATTPSSHDKLPEVNLPSAFTWCNNNGVNYCTRMRNQHIPQYCGACWAHGAISALGDRVKFARKAAPTDIDLSVQHVLNCANVGSCYGGDIAGTYGWLLQVSQQTGTGIAFETANPYLACSSDVDYGICQGQDWSCTPLNTARACGTFPSNGGTCNGLPKYPNVTISDYGTISGADAMMKEIFTRGPISCGVDALPLLQYSTGIVTDSGDSIDHVVSIVGWGKDPSTGMKYWIVRNSWGEYWGEMGWFRVQLGVNALQIETQCAWAVPQTWTELASQSHCSEDGSVCDL